MTQTARELADEIWTTLRLQVIDGRDRMDSLKWISAIEKWLVDKADELHNLEVGNERFRQLQEEVRKLDKKRSALKVSCEQLEMRRDKLKETSVRQKPKALPPAHSDVRS